MSVVLETSRNRIARQRSPAVTGDGRGEGCSLPRRGHRPDADQAPATEVASRMLRDAGASNGPGGEAPWRRPGASIFVGIDPGAGGAIASLDSEGRLVAVEDMPTVMVKVGKTDRARVSASILRDLLTVDADAITMVVIEKVGGMTGQSASASFTFGYGCGLVEGVIAALSLPIVMVTPQAWKRSAGIASAKGAAREAAMRLWPAQAGLFARAKDDGRAEAALLARHGWLQVARTRAA